MPTPRYRMQLSDLSHGVVLFEGTIVGTRLADKIRNALLECFPVPRYAVLTLKIEGLEPIEGDDPSGL